MMQIEVTRQMGT